jgi:hypothetical protein
MRLPDRRHRLRRGTPWRVCRSDRRCLRRRPRGKSRDSHPPHYVLLGARLAPTHFSPESDGCRDEMGIQETLKGRLVLRGHPAAKSALGFRAPTEPGR